jgi:hypothetical protein
MRNRIDMGHAHSRAISEQIGERLRACLKDRPALPATLRQQIDRLHELQGQSPSIVPNSEHEAANKPEDARREDRFQSRLSRRKS